MYFQLRELILQTATDPQFGLPCLTLEIKGEHTQAKLSAPDAWVLAALLRRYELSLLGHGSSQALAFIFSGIEIEIYFKEEPHLVLIPCEKGSEKISASEVPAVIQALTSMSEYLNELKAKRDEIGRNQQAFEMFQQGLPELAKIAASLSPRRRRDDGDQD